MEIALLVGIIALTLMFVAVVLMITKYQAKRRRELLQSAAQQLGLQYSEADTANIMEQLAGFQLFQQGRRRKLFNLIVADASELNIAVFDYEFITGSGKSQQTHRTTVIAVTSNQLSLPGIGLRPENLFDAIVSLFGGRDIDFPENENFSRSFLLKSTDEEAARKLFNASLMDFFAARRGVSLEALGNRFIYFRRGKRTKPEELKTALSEGLDLHNLLIGS